MHIQGARIWTGGEEKIKQIREVTGLAWNMCGLVDNLSKVIVNGKLVTMPSFSGGHVRVDQPLLMMDVKIPTDMDRGSWIDRHDRVNLFNNAINDDHPILLWPIECKDASSEELF